MVLGVVLGLWLLLMGIGAGLGRTAERLRDQLAALAVIQMLLAVLPLAQVFLLRALRNVVFIRGAAVGVTETVGAAFVLLLPYCLVAGYALTLACAILGAGGGAGGDRPRLRRRQRRQHCRRRPVQLCAGPLARPHRHPGLSRAAEPGAGVACWACKFEVQGSRFRVRSSLLRLLPALALASGRWPDRRHPSG